MPFEKSKKALDLTRILKMNTVDIAVLHKNLAVQVPVALRQIETFEGKAVFSSDSQLQNVKKVIEQLQKKLLITTMSPETINATIMKALQELEEIRLIVQKGTSEQEQFINRLIVQLLNNSLTPTEHQLLTEEVYLKKALSYENVAMQTAINQELEEKKAGPCTIAFLNMLEKKVAKGVATLLVQRSKTINYLIKKKLLPEANILLKNLNESIEKFDEMAPEEPVLISAQPLNVEQKQVYGRCIASAVGEAIENLREIRDTIANKKNKPRTRQEQEEDTRTDVLAQTIQQTITQQLLPSIGLGLAESKRPATSPTLVTP